jgi:hypothetical protein
VSSLVQLIRSFVERIEVFQPEKVPGTRTKKQTICIHWNYIGVFDIPEKNKFLSDSFKRYKRKTTAFGTNNPKCGRFLLFQGGGAGANHGTAELVYLFCHSHQNVQNRVKLFLHFFTVTK